MQNGNRRPRAIQQAHPPGGGTAGDRRDVVTADESLSGARADAEPAIASFVAIRTVYFDKLASTLDGAARWIAGKTVTLDRAMVRRVSTSTRILPLRTFAIVLSRLGNGSIYAVLPVLIFARFGKNAIDIIFIATCNIAVLHAFYPALKRRIGRRRPFEVDGKVRSLLDVLDEHSFPSGHIMTLAAALVPVFYIDPGSTAYGSGLLAAMGWARVATGHHYPTDIVAGAVLALVAGYPLTALWFSAY